MPIDIPGKYIGPSYLVGNGTVLDYSFEFSGDKSDKLYIQMYDGKDRIIELPRVRGKLIDVLRTAHLEIYISYLEAFHLEGIEGVYVTFNVNNVNLNSYSIPIKKFEKAHESEGNPTTMKYRVQLSEVYKDNPDIRTVYRENVKKAKQYPSLRIYSPSTSDQSGTRRRSSPIFFP
jgi:hypothetical protein